MVYQSKLLAKLLRSTIIVITIFFITITTNVLSEVNSKEIYKTAEEIYSEVYSPYCPGRLLKDCPSSKAEKLKENIFLKISKGMPKEEVIDEILKKYGDDLASVPKLRGFAALAWIVPIVFVLLGLLVVWWFVRKR